MPRLILLCLPLLVLCGCSMDFGTVIATTHPTQGQLDRCRSAMYLNSNLVFSAKGYKEDGTGIDGIAWLVFSTSETDPAAIFQTNTVDVSKLKEGATLPAQQDQDWWIRATDGPLRHSQFELPNVKFMDVYIESTDTGGVVFINWFET